MAFTLIKLKCEVRAGTSVHEIVTPLPVISNGPSLNFRRFDWINAVSGKILTLFESAPRHSEVLKFVWQLSTTNQDQSSETGPVHTQVSLMCTRKVQCESTYKNLNEVSLAVVG